jgi:hypothetical protein
MRIAPLLISVLMGACSFQPDRNEVISMAQNEYNMEFKKTLDEIDLDKDMIADRHESKVNKSILNYPRVKVSEVLGLKIDFNLGGCEEAKCYFQKSNTSKQKISEQTNRNIKKTIESRKYFNEFNTIQLISDIKDQQFFPFKEMISNTSINTNENQPEIEVLFNLEISDFENIKRINNLMLELGIISNEGYLKLGVFNPKSINGQYFSKLNKDSKSKIETNSALEIKGQLGLGAYELEKFKRMLHNRGDLTIKVVNFDYVTVSNVKLDYHDDLIEDKLNLKNTELAKISILSNDTYRTEFVIPSNVKNVIKSLYPESLLDRGIIKDIDGDIESNSEKWIIKSKINNEIVEIDTEKQLKKGQTVLVEFKQFSNKTKSLDDEIKIRTNSNNSVEVNNVRVGDILDVQISGEHLVYTTYPVNTFSTLFNIKINNNSIITNKNDNVELRENINKHDLEKIIKISNHEVSMGLMRGHEIAFLQGNHLRFRVEIKDEFINNDSVLINIDDAELKSLFYSKTSSEYKKSRKSPEEIQKIKLEEERKRDIREASIDSRETLGSRLQ